MLMLVQQYLPPEATDRGSFRTFLKNIDSGTTKTHHHPSYELNLVLKGEGTRYVGTHQDYFEEGDLVLIGPDIPHNWVNKKLNSSAIYSSLVLQWDKKFVDGMCQVTPEFNQIGKLLSLSAKGVVLNKEYGKDIRKRKTDLLNLPPFERIILLLQLLNEFSKSDEYKFLSAEGFNPKKSIPNSRFEKIQSFVEENYSEKISLKTISSVINMSAGAFSRYFSQTFNKPFFTYLNEFRIGKSCNFLETTDMRINEIGYACGYDCLQFFYRQFMKYNNCAPLEYRRKFLNNDI